MSMNGFDENSIPQFFMQRLQEQYSASDIKRILDGYSKPRKVTIRVNTLKASVDEVKEILSKNNISFSIVGWSEEALILNNVEESVVQKLEIYEAGKIYLQSLSSMLPPIILKPEKGEDILDMCAAPRK